jgi:hypothetical protein
MHFTANAEMPCFTNVNLCSVTLRLSAQSAEPRRATARIGAASFEALSARASFAPQDNGTNKVPQWEAVPTISAKDERECPKP